MDQQRESIRDCVIDCLHEMLDKANLEHIDEQTDPIKKLGLDSADGLDFACALSQRLGYHIPDDLNPFVDDAKNRPRRVGEIVDLMCKLLPARQEA